LFDVTGNLTLDGTLNVSDAGGFGAGVYRIIDYTGTLTDNGLDIGQGSPDAANLSIQTAVAGEVNLVDSGGGGGGQTLQFWDGGDPGKYNNNAVDGGSGTWTTTGPAWTDANGAQNGAMSPQPGFAVLEGTAGTVTVDDAGGTAPVSVTGMQFATSGYTVTGDAITLVGTPRNHGRTAAPVIRVGDGTADGASMTATIQSVLQGTAGLTKTDLGTLILTGQNTYTGGTTIAGGTLQLGDGGTSGSIRGNVTDQGVLAFDRSDVVTFRGRISGSGSVEQDGTGTTILSGHNTYRGATTIEAGTLAAGGNFVFSAASRTVIDSGGTLDLAGTRQHIDRIDLDGGTLEDGKLSGSVVSFGGTIDDLGGRARLRTVSGTTLMTGRNRYAGSTVVGSGSTLLGGSADAFSKARFTEIEGTLDLGGFDQRLGRLGGDGTITDSGAGAATLTVGANRAFSLFSGSIEDGSGVVGLTKTGSGTLVLDGVSTYTGATTVEGGKLVVGDDHHAGASLASTVTVDRGGTLGGRGSIGGLVVERGGTVAPGNSIGTLTVNGDVTFEKGSTYAAEIGRQSDLIHATGTATLNGGSVWISLEGGYQALQSYVILQADGGITGQFASIKSNYAFIDPLLGYTGDEVTMTLARNNVAFAAVALTQNQAATGAAVDSLAIASSPVASAVAVLDAGQARNAFNQLSGEAHASLAGAMIEDSRFVRDAAFDRLRDAFCDTGFGAGPDRPDASGVAAGAGCEVNPGRFTAWGHAFGSWGHVGTDGNASGLSRTIGGFIAGLDAPVFEDWRAGLLAGYSQSSFDVKGRGSSATSNDYSVGLYGGRQWGALALRLGGAYTWHDIDTDRSVVFDGFAGYPQASYHAGTAQAFGELGYDLAVGGLGLEPFANLAYVNQHVDGFTEEGSAAALTAAGRNEGVTFSTLGVHLASTFDAAGLPVTARATLGWRHAYGDTDPASLFTFAGGSSVFEVAGVPVTRDAAVVEAGFDVHLTSNTTLGLSYGGQFGRDAVDQSAHGTLAVSF